MFLSQISVAFKVSTVVKPNETVCVVGNCPQLGNWMPDKCHQLQRTSSATGSSGKETWYGEIKINSGFELQYRYLIALIHEGEDGDDRDILVKRWETNIEPRKLTPDVTKSNGMEVAEFGTYDGSTRIDKGWLTMQTEVHLRLHGNPINMYRTALKKQSFLIKCTPLDLRHQESVDAEDEDAEENLLVCPTNIEYVLLKKDCDQYQEQEKFGCLFQENDYLIFRAQTLDTEYLGYHFTFFIPAAKGEEPKVLGHSYLLPVNIRESYGTKSIPINGVKFTPIGELKVHYFIIKPMRGHKCDMKQSFSKHWRYRQKAYDVAHRGMGNSYTKKLAATRENTVASLVQASEHGADFVEFDIQLSRDLVPIVYHDMTVCLTLKQKQKEGLEYFTVPVSELNLIQLQQLRVDHSSEMENSPSVKKDEDYEEPDAHKPFPTLEEICQSVDPHVGFNIEIKYCIQMKGGAMEEGLKHFMERNEYVDRLLTSIFQYCGDRRVIISCFDPDVVTMIRLKQNKYPVLFLTIGECQAYEPYLDPRCWDVPMGASFVASEECLGIDPHAHDFLRDPSLVALCKKKNLVVFCWGDENNDVENITKLQAMGVDGIIYDKISELKKGEKENIFRMEHSKKVKLLKDVGAISDTSGSGTSLQVMSPPSMQKSESGDLV